MFPSLSTNDARNGGRLDAEAFGQSCERERVIGGETVQRSFGPQLQDRASSSLGQLALGVLRATKQAWLAERLVSVLLVFQGRSPFQVLNSVLSFLSVLVIDLVSWGRSGTEERFGDKDMHQTARRFSISTQVDPVVIGVYGSRWRRLQDFSDERVSSVSFAPHTSAIRNRIHIFEAFHRLPYFLSGCHSDDGSESGRGTL